MGFELILPFLRPIEPLLLDDDVSAKSWAIRMVLVVGAGWETSLWQPAFASIAPSLAYGPRSDRKSPGQTA